MAKSNTGINKLCELSDELAEIVGKSKASRPQVMKAVWAYIKANDLQDEDDRRTILPDETLGAVIGNKPINMMKMTKKLAEHIS